MNKRLHTNTECSKSSNNLREDKRFHVIKDADNSLTANTQFYSYISKADPIANVMLYANCQIVLSKLKNCTFIKFN